MNRASRADQTFGNPSDVVSIARLHVTFQHTATNEQNFRKQRRNLLRLDFCRKTRAIARCVWPHSARLDAIFGSPDGLSGRRQSYFGANCARCAHGGQAVQPLRESQVACLLRPFQRLRLNDFQCSPCYGYADARQIGRATALPHARQCERWRQQDRRIEGP